MSFTQPRKSTTTDEAASSSHVPAPIFTPVLPPKIMSTSHADLVRWRRERKEYEETVKARAGETNDLLISIKNSFEDQDHLKTLCRFSWKTPFESITDERIMTEIDKIISSVKNNSLPDIEAEMKEQLTMNLSQSDVRERVVEYFKRYYAIIAENGWQSLFNGSNATKEHCRLLITSLQPKALREEVRRATRYGRTEASENEEALFDLVMELALEHEKLQQRQKRRREDTEPSEDSGNQGKRQAKTARRSKGKNGYNSASDRMAPGSTDHKPVKKGKDRPTEPPSPCPKCRQMHWLSECTSATDAEKVELRKKLRAERASQSNNKNSRAKRVKDCLPSDKRTVTLNGCLQLPYCADTGADRTIISRDHVDTLAATDPTVSRTALLVPVRSIAIGSHVIEAKETVSLRVLINTAAGVVAIREPVECLIINDHEDEFIVGADLLRSLGIDIERQLEQLAERVDSDDDDACESDDDVQSADQVNSITGETSEALELLVQDALDNGFPESHSDRLRTLIGKYDVWRLDLGADPPARVPPLVIRPKPTAEPVKSKSHRYPPAMQLFLRDFNEQLVRMGLVYENPSSRWASQALPVAKRGSSTGEYRQTVNYKEVNARTEAMVGVMPHMSALLEHTRGEQHFGVFDFVKGFWQLPLAEECQEMMSYITDTTIYTPRRVPQGCCDAAVHFQQTMENCFRSMLYNALLIWIDDLMLHAADIETYLTRLAEMLSIVDKYRLKLSAKKSRLYRQSVKWCGRVITKDGVAHDPERIETLRAIPYPTTAGQLQQFLSAANWMRESLVDYARVVDPLQMRLDAALAGGKRTKRAAAGIAIELSSTERDAFDATKQLLSTAATLAIPDDSATTCLFTDASDNGWAIIVTQVHGYAPLEPINEQRHELITCMGGTFRGSQLNWTVIEKEAYPIVVACDKLDYLLLRPQGFRLFCDHRNLIHVFAPGEAVKKHVRGKLLRWSLKLMGYRYVIEHIEGPKNLWADMVSRWAGQQTTVLRLKRLTVRKRNRRHHATSSPPVVLRPLDADGFVWPGLTDIKLAQRRVQPPSDTVAGDDALLRRDDRIWIPAEAQDLLQRLLVVAHCGAQGHRGAAAMRAHLARLFAIDRIDRHITSFLKSCLLCAHVKGGRMVMRPWSDTIECSERNGVLHWDFLFLGKSYGDSNYLLVLKDHATHFCELVVCDQADSAAATAAIMDWHSRFGVPPVWVSDNGSHFKNEVVAELSRRLKSRQHFTLAYSPWVNGSVERVNRDILQVLRTMILDYKVSHKDWVYLVPMVQSSLNHTAVPSLGNKAPVELFTGLECPSPLREFYNASKKELVKLPAGPGM